MRFDKSAFALCNSARREGLRPRPARLMKYVNIRIPEPGPLGETFFEAKASAIADAFFLNSPGGGWVESVFTEAIHFFALLFRGRLRFIKDSEGSSERRSGRPFARDFSALFTGLRKTDRDSLLAAPHPAALTGSTRTKRTALAPVHGAFDALARRSSISWHGLFLVPWLMSKSNSALVGLHVNREPSSHFEVADRSRLRLPRLAVWRPEASESSISFSNDKDGTHSTTGVESTSISDFVFGGFLSRMVTPE